MGTSSRQCRHRNESGPRRDKGYLRERLKGGNGGRAGGRAQPERRDVRCSVAAMVISHHLPLQEAAAAEYRLASAEARRDDGRRMHARVREPTRTRRPRAETAPAEPELLALQRTAGNQ